LRRDIRAIRPVDGDVRDLFARFGWAPRATLYVGELTLPSAIGFQNVGMLAPGTPTKVLHNFDEFAKVSAEAGLDFRPYAGRPSELIQILLERDWDGAGRFPPLGHAVLVDRHIVGAWVHIAPQGDLYPISQRDAALAAPAHDPPTPSPTPNRYPQGVNMTRDHGLAATRSPATGGDRLDPELPREEIQDPPVRILCVSALREPVALIWIDHVLDAAAERTKALDDLIGFLLRDTRVVLALEDQHRAAHVLDVRDRRSLDELRAVVLEITDPSCQEATPVRLRVLDHGHKVRDAENVDGTPPHVGYLRHAEERREPAIRAAIDGEARAVEVLLFAHPVSHRA